MKRIFKRNGVHREVKVGFSWTVFFFGFIALLVRGQAIEALITLLTFGLAALYYCFTANRLLTEKLKLEGWSES